MTYINPITLLSLERDYSSDDLKKAKRRLKADIELADEGEYNFTWSDVEKAINQLNDNQVKEAYHQLSVHPAQKAIETQNPMLYVLYPKTLNSKLTSKASKIIKPFMTALVKSKALEDFKMGRDSFLKQLKVFHDVINEQEVVDAINKEMSNNSFINKANDRTINIINILPDSLFHHDVIRFAKALRREGIKAYNDSENIDEATRMIKLVLKLNAIDVEMIKKLKGDIVQLKKNREAEIKQKEVEKIINFCHFCDTRVDNVGEKHPRNTKQKGLPVPVKMYRWVWEKITLITLTRYAKTKWEDGKRYGASQYQYTTVKITRCKECEQYHNRSLWTKWFGPGESARKEEHNIRTHPTVAEMEKNDWLLGEP